MKAKLFSLIATASLVLGVSEVYAGEKLDESVFIQDIAHYLADLKNIDTAYWPGYHVEKMPILLAFNEPKGATYAYDVNPQANWKKITPDLYKLPKDFPKPAESLEYKVIDDQHPLVENYSRNCTSWSWSWNNETNSYTTTCNGPLPYVLDNTYKQKLNVERFYYYLMSTITPQEIERVTQLVSKEPEKTAASLATQSKYAFLKIAALKDYLKTNKKEALKNYIAIDQLSNRELGIDMTSPSYLMNEYLNELSYYIAQKGAPDGIRNVQDWSTINDELDQACSNNASPEDCYASMHYRLEDGLAISDSDYGNLVVRAVSQALESGPLAKTWKTPVDLSNPMPMSMILANQYAMSDSAMTAQMEKAKAKYNFAGISALVDKVMDPYLKKMQEAEDAYAKNPGTELSLNILDRNISSGYWGDSSHYGLNLYLTQDKSILSNVTVYTLSRNYVFATLNNLSPFYDLQNRNSKDKIESRTVKFKLSPTAKVILDGNEASLSSIIQNNVPVSFTTLTLVDDTVAEKQPSVTVEIPGSIQIVNGQLSIVINEIPATKPNTTANTDTSSMPEVQPTLMAAISKAPHIQHH